MKRIYLVFFSLLFISVLSFAEPLALTLNQALDYAVKNNADLKTKSIELESAKRSDNAAWNNFLPSLSLNGSISNSHTVYNGIKGTWGSGNSSDKSAWSWSGSAGVSISLSTSIPIKIKQTALTYAIAQTAYDKLESETKQKVISSFYSLIASQKNIEILKDSLELSNQQLKQTQTNYNNGLASELELLKAKYSYQSIGPQITQAQTSYAASSSSFLLLLGLDTKTSFTLESSLELQQLLLPNADILADSYAEKRYDVIQGHQNVTKAELALALSQQNTLAPSLNLNENFRSGGDIQENNTVKPSVNGSFSVSISIPVDGWIPGSQQNLSLKNAKDNITATEISLESILKNAKQDICQKTATVNQLYESLEVNKLNCQVAERAYELAFDGYRAGLVSQTDLASQQQSRVSAKQTLIQAEINYITSISSLASALNITQEELISQYGVTK